MRRRVEKIARAAEAVGVKAGDVQVFCRILATAPERVASVAQVRLRARDGRRVLEHACRQGLHAYGVSFHVGSQQGNTEVGRGAGLRRHDLRECADRGITLSMVNLAALPDEVSQGGAGRGIYGDAIFGRSPCISATTCRDHHRAGRGMVGNAGMIEAEVVLVSRSRTPRTRSLGYLDIGKFGGLAETLDESIRYAIRTEHDGDRMSPCVLAGPTCDSADVLYEKAPNPLPGLHLHRRQGADRRRGRLHHHLCGGAFNGFPPLQQS